ncbi:MAG: hypothetical protein QOI05_1042 [Bradyrhizobium sp.]|nr:hypothetical protein [Bradyrhizobium sp.]
MKPIFYSFVAANLEMLRQRVQQYAIDVKENRRGFVHSVSLCQQPVPNMPGIGGTPQDSKVTAESAVAQLP